MHLRLFHCIPSIHLKTTLNTGLIKTYQNLYLDNKGIFISFNIRYKKIWGTGFSSAFWYVEKSLNVKRLPKALVALPHTQTYVMIYIIQPDRSIKTKLFYIQAKGRPYFTGFQNNIQLNNILAIFKPYAVYSDEFGKNAKFSPPPPKMSWSTAPSKQSQSYNKLTIFHFFNSSSFVRNTPSVSFINSASGYHL